jgi:acetoin utilization deacetylase AcuC-like enzyme
MKLVFTENVHALKLPPSHRFPIAKYERIHRALAEDHSDLMMLGAPAVWNDVLAAHDATYVEAVRNATLAEAAVRRLGFPWSDSLVTRAQRSVGGTLAALEWAVSQGAAGHIAGGTHHAFRDRGEGFCVFNDIAVAIAIARRDHGLRRAAVVDLDVHQGNGTASMFSGDPDVFTLSLHGAHNYPFRKEQSSRDVALPDRCDDATYLRALGPALEEVAGFRPDVLFYQAGVDTLAGDRLGRMALALDGLAKRDAMVFSLARQLGVPLVVTLGGGYGRDIDRTVAAHVQVYRGLVSAFRS